MLRKLKKVFPAVISALLCVTMVLGITASAANANIWKDTKALTSLKYNSNYIKWAEKYSAKEAKNTVSYSKSRTKKFLDKFQKKATAEKPEYIFGLINSDNMLCYVFKENGFKGVSLIDGECTVLYLNDNAMTVISPYNKTKAFIKVNDDETEAFNEIASEQASKYSNEAAETFDFDISENKKGKLFKFKSDEKIYYYEEFEKEEGGSFGFLFDSKGRPLAFINDGASCCFIVSYSVYDSEFDIPSGYKKVKTDDLNLNLSNRR